MNIKLHLANLKFNRKEYESSKEIVFGLDNLKEEYKNECVKALNIKIDELKQQIIQIESRIEAISINKEVINDFINENRYTWTFDKVMEYFKNYQNGCYLPHSMRDIITNNEEILKELVEDTEYIDNSENKDFRCIRSCKRKII